MTDPVHESYDAMNQLPRLGYYVTLTPDRRISVRRASASQGILCVKRLARIRAAQLAAPVVPGGPSSTVGTYSNSWSPPSKVRLSTRSSLMSGYPS